MTNSHKLLMLLVNLLSKAGNDMDTLLVEQRRLGVTLEGPWMASVRINVRDNGVGIAPEMLTASSSTASPPVRMGMASACITAPWRLRHWGGAMRAQSNAPDRATFTLELPCVPAGT